MKTPKIKGYGTESAQVLGIVFELGFAIALPIVLFALGGKWLDHREGTGYFVYIGIALAIIFTSAWVYQRFAAMVVTLQETAKQHSAEIKESSENSDNKENQTPENQNQ